MPSNVSNNNPKNYRRKLCIITPTHWQARMGGAEYQVSIILKKLVLNPDYKIYYLTRRLNSAIQPEGYQIIQIADHHGIRRKSFFFDAPRLIKILKKIRPHIIYQRVGCAYTGIAAYYAKRNKCKLIWHISSDRDVSPSSRRSARNFMFPFIEKKFLEYGITHANLIIAQTTKQSKVLNKFYSRSPDAVIPNFHPFPEENVKKTNPVKIVWIGNLKPVKQPEIFIKLAQDFKNVQDVQFIMIGAMNDRLKWKHLIDMGEKSSQLKYMGELSHVEVNSMLARAHILVNTSTFEGLPNTFIQAWMREVPVISLKVNPDEIITKKQIGLVSGSYERLKRNTEELIDNYILRTKMGKRAKNYAAKKYSIQNLDSLMRIIHNL